MAAPSFVRGRLWRKSNPALQDQTRRRLVEKLMSARRAVRDVKGDRGVMVDGWRRVDEVKASLGERGPVW